MSADHPNPVSLSESFFAAGKYRDALVAASQAKAQRANWPEADTARARCFQALGDLTSARQAALEALRHDPVYPPALELLDSLIQGKTKREESEGLSSDPLITRALPHTMLSVSRLSNLVAMIDAIAENDIDGVLVECGVAGGGSLSLLAGAAMRAGIGNRAVYGFDTFTGMPAPTASDTASSVPANESGWGAGTCAAPRGAVGAVLCESGVQDQVELVQGRFEQTLHDFAAYLKSKGVRIAFLHADGDWYSSTQAIFTHLAPCLSAGARVQVDDYGHWDGCRKAVDEYLSKCPSEIILHEVDYTGRWLQWPG